MSSGYEIIHPRSKVDRNKLIELGHMIRGTYPTRGASTNLNANKSKNGKPTLKLRNWRTIARTRTRAKSTSSLNSNVDPVRAYQDSQRAMK